MQRLFVWGNLRKIRNGRRNPVLRAKNFHSLGANHTFQAKRLQRPDIRAMTIRAFRKRLLIHDHWLSIDQARLFVTFITGDVCMASL